MCCPSRFHPLSSAFLRTHTQLQWHTVILGKICLLLGIRLLRKPFASLPLESKWHCMGAAEPLLACRRIPAAASTKCTPHGSIFLWYGPAAVIPLWSPISLIYTSYSFAVVGSEVASAAVTWPSGLAEGVGEPCHLSWNKEVLIYRRWSEGKLVFWHCFGHTGDHLAMLQWAWTSCDTNNDICNAVTKRKKTGREEIEDSNRLTKVLEGFAGLEPYDVTREELLPLD